MNASLERVETNEMEGVDITADSLEYQADKKLMIASGNVLVKSAQDMLKADYMTLRTDTQDLYARGNVIARRGAKIWQGQELRYNLKTRQGDFGEFTAFTDPYYITAKDSKRIGTNQYLLKNVTISTCGGDRPEYVIRAREATLTDGTQLHAKGVTLSLGGVPIFWLPSLKRNLVTHDRYWEVVPGYSSRMGAFLLTAYNVKLNKEVKTITRLDYRTKRGVGVGQDVEWRGTNRQWSGEARTYYTHDQEPFRDSEDEAATKDVKDNDRYRLKLGHNQNFTPRDSFIGQVNYLSDPDVLDDFFNEEFRYQSQPENRLTLTHRGDKYTASAQLNKRLNDFYENVDRLPELALNIQRQRMGESGFFYESQNTASYLEKVFPDDADDDEYDAFRVDSRHRVYYPTRQFGFLNLTPLAGYRATYYSNTRETSTVTNTLVQTDTNGMVSVTNVVDTVVKEGNSDLRNVYELGLESSLKAFRTWDDLIVLEDGNGLRHVAEPYARYSYLPRPNLRPEELPQFDRVDTIDRTHEIRLGMRNKFQTRHGTRLQNLLDADVYTTYRIEREDGQKDFSSIFFDTELRLVEWLPIDFDGEYDQYEGEIAQFSTQIAFLMEDDSSIAVEYRYRRDRQNLFSGEVTLFPNDKWSFDAYGRYDGEAGQLEEQSYFVRRKTACMSYGLGFKKVDEDMQVWLQIGILAFPGSSVKMGN